MANALNAGRRTLWAIGLAILLAAFAGAYSYTKHKNATQSQNLELGTDSDSMDVPSLDIALPPTVEEIWPGSATCLTPNKMDDLALLAELDNQSTVSPHISDRIAGFDFDQQPQVLMQAFARLTRDLPATDGNRKTNCGTVACAADQVFGTGIGLRLLYVLVRYQYNGSHFSAPGAEPWTVSELDTVIAALHDFPPSLLPFHPDHNRPLLRDGRIERFAGLIYGPETSLVAINVPNDKIGIRVGNLWDQGYRSFQRVAIFHELAHDFMRSQQALFDARDKWQNAIWADMLLSPSKVTPFRHVSRYATSGLDEDFAESAVAYRYMPTLLKGRAPHRFRLLQFWMFDGLDYTDAATCSDARSLSVRAAGHAIAEMVNVDDAQSQFAPTMAECRRNAIGPPSAARSAEIRTCVISKIFPGKFGRALTKTIPMAATSPVAKAIAASRTRNTPFNIEQPGLLGAEKSLEITDAMRRNGCGGDCHMPPVPPVSAESKQAIPR